MKYLILAILLLTSACAHRDLGLAPPAEMPALPNAMSQKAKRLPPITDPTMGGQVISGVETDRAYNRVAEQLNAIIDAWECVRIGMNEKKEIKSCLK